MDPQGMVLSSEHGQVEEASPPSGSPRIGGEEALVASLVMVRTNNLIMIQCLYKSTAYRSRNLT